jgi:hypothetical protein
MRSGLTLLVVAGLGVVAALALADALRPKPSSSNLGTASTRSAPPPPTTTFEVEPSLAKARTDRLPRRYCGTFRIAPRGEYPPLAVEVVRGHASCEEARQVMKAHYVGGDRGSWVCHGPEGSAECLQAPGEAIGARFARGSSPAEQVERFAVRWARSFSHSSACYRMTQPLCQRVDCERVGGIAIPNCTPLTVAYRRSFAGATVEEIARKGRRVAVKLSNGELIRVVGVVGGVWLVHEVGWNAGREVLD